MRLLSTRARGRRLLGRLGLKFTELSILVVSLGVAAMGASTLVALQRSADEARRAELLVARIAESATSLHDQTTQALDGGFAVGARSHVRRDRLRLAAAMRSLRALDPDERRIPIVDRRQARFVAAVKATLRSVIAGREREAKRRHVATTLPAFTVLQATVEEASEHYDDKAATAARTTALGSALAVIAAALLVALLAIALSRRRAAREQAALNARTAMVRLLQAVSAASNSAATLEDALRATLAEICTQTGWALGHAYVRAEDGSDELVSTGLWKIARDHERFRPFVEDSDRRRFGAGHGLPGRVLSERRPLWITAVTAAASALPRARVARLVGIESSFAFPVFVGDDVVAVLEFFSADVREPDEPLLEASAHIGFQLGYLMQRKRAEAELRETEARYRTLVEQLPLATYIDGPQGLESTTYLSPQIAEMSGYSSDEWLADKRLFQKILHPDDRERVIGAIRHATANAEPIEQEYRIVTRDGRLRWWRDAAVVVRDAAGRPRYRQGYAVDVTERRESEERLAEAENRYRTLVEQLPLATYIDALDENSSAIYMSPQIEAMLGYTADEWTTDEELFPKILHPEDRERVMAEVRRTQQTGDPFRCEYRLIGRDGRVVWIHDEDVTIRDERGRPLYAQGYMLDISARKQTEEALELSLERERAANEHLRELDRLKDEFIALVSHELRTPLTSIRGYLEFLLEDADGLTPDHARFLTVVDRNAERLQHLVNDLLFVAQIDAGRLTIEQAGVDLPALADEAVEAARVVASAKAIELELDVGPVQPLVGDRARLAQLLDNFISNAIKFTPEGGRVTVGVRGEGEFAVFSVADSGIGIGKEDQERLFERFYRAASATERAIPGTGLGLAIAKAIVDAHGGSISVESEEGAGTTFTVALPLAAEGAAEQQAA